VSVGLLINIDTDRPASFKDARQRLRYFCRLQLEYKAATLTLLTSHIARRLNI